MIQKNKRIKIDKQRNGKNGNTLYLFNAEVADGGIYKCQVSTEDRIEVKHEVQIRGRYIDRKIHYRDLISVKSTTMKI